MGEPKASQKLAYDTMEHRIPLKVTAKRGCDRHKTNLQWGRQTDTDEKTDGKKVKKSSLVGIADLGFAQFDRDKITHVNLIFRHAKWSAVVT